MAAQVPDAAPLGALLESFPDETVESIAVRNAWRRGQAADSRAGLEFLISDVVAWVPGSTVRVAFLGGASALRAKIVAATAQITEACNLVLDFGDEADGFRSWTERDSEYAAEIRVSFDLTGYYSLVGTDSTDRTLGTQQHAVGGRPHQRSLNLGGFDKGLPERWEGTVRHEFMHAVAFHHEHQNMRGPCSVAFRWEDDVGYQPTTDAHGVFVPDVRGRSPGIYTYLAGPPNRWPRRKIDHNLRTVEDAPLIAGGFDPDSVMLYRFAPFFYLSLPSPCAPLGDGVDLSHGDKRGLGLLYPYAAGERRARQLRATGALRSSGLESGGASLAFEARFVELLVERAGLR